MSLESDIQELTVAVRALTHALGEHRAIASATHAIIEKHEPRSVAEDFKKEEIPNDQPQPPKPSTTTDTSPPSSNESRTVTYDDVKNVTIAVSKIDKAKAVAGLARFGVQTAKSLNESQWPDYVVYMEKVASGEIDPEASHE